MLFRSWYVLINQTNVKQKQLKNKSVPKIHKRILAIWLSFSYYFFTNFRNWVKNMSNDFVQKVWIFHYNKYIFHPLENVRKILFYAITTYNWFSLNVINRCVMLQIYMFLRHKQITMLRFLLYEGKNNLHKICHNEMFKDTLVFP